MTTPLHEIVTRSSRLVESTKKNYLADIDRWIAFAGVDTTKWTRYRAQEFYDYLIAVEGVKPQTATRVLAGLRYAASLWAKLEGKPDLDFTSAIEHARTKGKAKRSALTEEQAKKLLLHCRDFPLGAESTRDFALFVVALETGMRQMSLESMELDATGIVALGLKDVQTIKRSYPFTYVSLKGRGTERVTIPLSDTAMRALTPWLTWLRTNRVQTGPVWRTYVRGARSFWSPTQRTVRVGDGFSFSALYKLVVRRAKAAGIGHVHPHIFRHTFITWRLTAGVPPEQIAAITRHRLEDDKLGTLYEYTDKDQQIAELARRTTPEWLRVLVEEATR